MNKYSSLVFIVSLIAIIGGGLAGYFLPDFMLSISFLGKLFFNGLKLIVIPFVIALIITGIASMGDLGKVKRSLGKTISYFLSTALVASVIGFLVTLIIQPGVGASKSNASIPEDIVNLNSFSLNKLLGSVLPDNILSASIELQLVGLILISMLIGLVLTQFNRKNKVVLDFFKSLHDVISDLMQYVFLIIPVGLFSLTGTLFAENIDNAQDLFSSLFLFSITIIISLSFFALVILPIVLKLFSHTSPYNYFSSLLPALATAFATDSAIATLPVTGKCVEDANIDSRASAFVLPLGAVFNAGGTALFISAAVLFIAQMYGESITLLEVFAIIGGSLLFSIFATLIPYSSLLILALTINITSLPFHITAGIGLLVIIDFLFSRLRTVVNVWSDAVGTVVIGNTFDFKTARVARTGSTTKRTYSKDQSKQQRKPRQKTDSYQSKKNETKPGRRKETESPGRKQRTVSKKTQSAKSRSTVNKETARKDKPSFEIPPVPYHVLENELKPPVDKTESRQSTAKKNIGDSQKPQIEKDDRKPSSPVVKLKQDIKDSAEDSVITKVHNVLSTETVERERAKIAAQLKMMREKESMIDPSMTQLEIDEADSDVTKQNKNSDNSFAKIDFYSDEPEEKPREVPFSQATKDNVTDKNSTITDEIKDEILPSSAPKLQSDESGDESESVSVAVSASESMKYGRNRSKRSSKPVVSNEEKTTDDSSKEDEGFDKSEYSVDNMSFGRGKRKK